MNVDVTLPSRTERYQWMRNREGGQPFGTRTLITPLDDYMFDRVLKPQLRWMYASSAAAYRARHAHATHLLLAQSSGEGPWRLLGVGLLEQLRPQGQARRQFARRVIAFAAPSAITWGLTADSDVYPIGSYKLEPCNHHTGGVPGEKSPGLDMKALAFVLSVGLSAAATFKYLGGTR